MTHRVKQTPPFSFAPSPFCFFCLDRRSSVSYTKLYRNSTFLLYTTAEPYASHCKRFETWIINAASAKFKLDFPPSKEIITDSKSSKYSSNSAATSMFQLSAKSLRISLGGRKRTG